MYYLCFYCCEIVSEKDLQKIPIRDKIGYCHKLCLWKIKYSYKVCTK